ncbi:MAG: universal stress protein [Adhaeribacter sp.]
MKPIIVPTDFSGNATHALHYAAALATQTKSKLVLAHAIADQTTISLEGSRLSLPADPQQQAYVLDLLEQTGRQLRQDTGFLLDFEAVCLSGYLLDHLNSLVRSQGAGLVIMGTWEAPRVPGEWLDTNTFQYIRHAVCPVLALPEKATFQEIKRVAYASDFETENEALYLRQLLTFTAPFKPEIFIVNIKSDQQIGVVSDQKVLNNIRDQFPENDFCLVQIRQDEVAEGLQGFVRDNQIDLLAIAIQKRMFLERLFHHSVSRELALHPFVPLLALPAVPFRMPEQDQAQKLPECL